MKLSRLAPARPLRRLVALRGAPALALVAACAGPGSAPAPPPGDVPMTNDDHLVVYSAGLDALLVDPADAGLLRALGMADERLLELVDEVGMSEVPAPLVRALLQALGSEASLQVRVAQGDLGTGPAARAQLVVHGDAADVEGMAKELDSLLEELLGPAGPDPLGSALAFRPTGVESSVDGVRLGVGGDGDGDGDRRMVLAVGDPLPVELGLGSLDLPRGIEPAFALKVDLGGLRAPIERFLEAMGPDADLVRAQLAMTGLLSEQPIVMTMAVGHDGEHAYYGYRQRSWTPLARRMGALVVEPLTPAELDTVPADATTAWLARMELSSILETVRAFEIAAGGDVVAEIRRETGIDVETELFDHLGTTVGCYLSESTGGGGLLSAVLYASVVDEEGLADTLGRLATLFNDAGRREADGLVQVRRWDCRGAQAHALTFPGLPVPLELGYVVTDGYVFLAASRQALVAAVDQARGARPGLRESEAFRAAAFGSLDDLQSLRFTDLGATLADGYGWASLLASALANGVRSRSNPSRDPGLVLPPYHELADGVGASVMLTRIEGDDLVTRGRMDRSFVANLTGTLGGPLGTVIAAGIGFGLVLPAVALGESSMPPVVTPTVPPADEELLEELRALGYVGEDEDQDDGD